MPRIATYSAFMHIVGITGADHLDLSLMPVAESALTPSGAIALRAGNGLFVTAERGGAVTAKRSEIGPWERFKIIPLGGNAFALQAANGMFVSAENGGGAALRAHGHARAQRETFFAFTSGIEDPSWHIQTWDRAHWLGADRGGKQEVSASRTSPARWDRFDIHRNGDFVSRTRNR